MSLVNDCLSYIRSPLPTRLQKVIRPRSVEQLNFSVVPKHSQNLLWLFDLNLLQLGTYHSLVSFLKWLILFFGDLKLIQQA